MSQLDAVREWVKLYRDLTIGCVIVAGGYFTAFFVVGLAENAREYAIGWALILTALAGALWCGLKFYKHLNQLERL